MNYLDIARAHEIKKIQVKDCEVIINGVKSYFYSHARIAKAVANKLKNFLTK